MGFERESMRAPLSLSRQASPVYPIQARIEPRQGDPVCPSLVDVLECRHVVEFVILEE